MFPVVSAIGGAVSWEVARRAKKAASKPAEEALRELRERERELRKELEVRDTAKRTKTVRGADAGGLQQQQRPLFAPPFNHRMAPLGPRLKRRAIAAARARPRTEWGRDLAFHRAPTRRRAADSPPPPR
jgi:hypothetical protein